LSASITAAIALGGKRLPEAVSFAIEQVYQTIAVNTKLGRGIHPAETRAL
jgi:hydroxymethylpyrimidine/phosphomethylpyrimidine kinase